MVSEGWLGIWFLLGQVVWGAENDSSLAALGRWLVSGPVPGLGGRASSRASATRFSHQDRLIPVLASSDG